MKHYYYSAALLFLTFSNSNGSYNYHTSSRSSCSKESSGGISRSEQKVKQDVKLQETSVQKQSFKYAQEHFKTLDISSQRLVGDVVHKLKTTTDPHDYCVHLGLFTALSVIKNAQQNPTILKAAYQNSQLQEQQAQNIKINLTQTFEDNLEQNSTIAQSISNFFVELAESFQKSKEQAREINRSLDRHAIGLPGLKHIKEFVNKFSQLSPEGKKTVGWLVLNANVSDALKVVAHGDKGVYFYDRTRKNDIVGANPRCKVNINETPDLLFSSHMKTFYTFDCPREEVPSSHISLRNNKCAYNLKGTIVCPSYETPFKGAKEIRGFDLIFLQCDYYKCTSFHQASHFDINYVKNEFALAKGHLKKFETFEFKDKMYSPQALNHLYAQALLIGQDVFNVNTLPQRCVQDMVQRYGTTFTLPKDTVWTKEEINNEINAARSYLNSHILFMNEVPSSFAVNQLQYAEALGVMESIVNPMLENIQESREKITNEQLGENSITMQDFRN